MRIDGHGGTDVHEWLAVAIRPVIEPAPHTTRLPTLATPQGPCALAGLSRGTQAARMNASRGLTSVVRDVAPWMQQGSITVTSGSLSSRPRPETTMRTAML